MVQIEGEGNKYSRTTTYDGVEMRSKMEARTARVFDELEIEWKYEPEAFYLHNGMTYIPDFYLPNLDTWVEG